MSKKYILIGAIMIIIVTVFIIFFNRNNDPEIDDYTPDDNGSEIYDDDEQNLITPTEALILASIYEREGYRLVIEEETEEHYLINLVHIETEDVRMVLTVDINDGIINIIEYNPPLFIVGGGRETPE